MIQKFTVSRDDSIYEAWPDVIQTPSGKLICVFSECTHHGDRSYTRLVYCHSTDRGRSWSAKIPLTDGTRDNPYWNCARIMNLRDGRLAIIADFLHERERNAAPEQMEIYLFFSEDDGGTWSPPQRTPAMGIVPDKLLELKNGRWVISSHHRDRAIGNLVQYLWYSDDKGATWSDRVTVGGRAGLNLCEVSILPVEDKLVAFLRENSGMGWPCYKAVSSDDGESWSNLAEFPLPGCHRPVTGHLQDGRILITYRFIQGGKRGGWGRTTNFFGALTDDASALADDYQGATTRIFPIDYDRSSVSDLGYSGWVQFDDGEVYVVNYIMDDSPKCQIRAYAFRPEELLLE